MAGFTFTHRRETVSDIADLLITASACAVQDKEINVPLFPMQARHLGRAIQDSIVLHDRHVAVMAEAAEARQFAEAALAKAKKDLDLACMMLTGALALCALSGGLFLALVL